MGEQADLIINGDVCEGCGEDFMEEGPGYPRRCSSCSGGSAKRRSGGNPLKQEKINEATRLFKAAGFKWETFNNGFHWKLKGLDFYPSTHRWMDLKNNFKGEGIKEFIKYVQKGNKTETKQILSVEQIFEIAKHSKDKSLIGICAEIHEAIYK